MIKRRIGIAVAVVLLFIVLGLAGCGNKESPQERIKRICGVDIPADAIIDYDYFDQSLKSDFVQYTVFILDEKATEFLESNSFENCLYCGEHEKDLAFLNHVATEYLPDWGKSHLFKKFETDGIDSGIQAMAFYFTDTNKLVIVAYAW